MNQLFEDLGVRTELAEALAKLGIRHPTPIQAKTIPLLMEGKDVIAQAQTGTGKTLAFLLPILEKIRLDKPNVQALIVTPTRELALQITEEAKKLAPALGVGVLAVYGGQDVEAQVHKLKRSAPIVVATPGRLLDHLRRETIRLDQVSMLVLDEADQMLMMGFLDEVEDILRQTPTERQTMLFSATMPDPIRKLASEFMRAPEDIRVREGRTVTLEGIQQLLIETTDRAKQDKLVERLQQYNPFLAVIFCRTKIRTKNLNQALLERGFNVDELHGDLTQARRERVMKRFRSADLQLLVATDVAARGLDVEGVTHVFNYDIPHDAESYIHRIGRTGRASQEGMAITFAAPRDRMYVEQIERGIGMRLEREGMPADGGANKRTNDSKRVRGNQGIKRDASGSGRSKSERGRQGGKRGSSEKQTESRRGQSKAGGRGRDARDTAHAERGKRSGGRSNPRNAGKPQPKGRGGRGKR